jgi:hypothetical protein
MLDRYYVHKETKETTWEMPQEVKGMTFARISVTVVEPVVLRSYRGARKRP